MRDEISWVVDSNLSDFIVVIYGFLSFSCYHSKCLNCNINWESCEGQHQVPSHISLCPLITISFSAIKSIQQDFFFFMDRNFDMVLLFFVWKQCSNMEPLINDFFVNSLQRHFSIGYDMISCDFLWSQVLKNLKLLALKESLATFAKFCTALLQVI